MRVLIVDDNTDAAEAFAVYLFQRGHQADVAADGEHGLSFMAANKYDAIVLDLVMPKMSGPEFLLALNGRQMPPVVVLTGYDTFYGEGLPGVVRVIKKPIEPGELEKLIVDMASRPAESGTTNGGAS